MKKDVMTLLKTWKKSIFCQRTMRFASRMFSKEKLAIFNNLGVHSKFF
jgi:hypothetical protein